MERRRSRRKSVSLQARIESPGAAFDGVIENISEHGLCMETDAQHLLKPSTRFQSGAEYEVRFQASSGGEIRLRCRVAWSYKAAPQGMKEKIGMEIVFPPPDYVEFYRHLGETQPS